MTPRERVLTALRHKEPDRVPFDLGGSILTGITTTAYKSLRAHMDLSPMHEMRIMDIVQQLAFVDEDMARKLQTDVRGIFLKDPSDWSLKIEEAGKYSRFTDPWGIGWQMPKRGGYYYDMYHHPLKGITADDVDKAPWPNPLDPARVKGLKEEAMKIRDEGFAVMMGNPFGAGVFEMVLWLQGFEDGFANLLADKKLTHKLLDKMMDLKLKFWDLYLTEVGECVDVVIDGDDVGIQETPMLSREMYREYILPRVKTIYSFIKKKAPNVFIFFHSCGSIYDILPDILETGVDILNPVQVSAAKMDTAVLKKEFGDRLVFWGGGVDTQEVLPHGTPAEVKEEVKRRIGDLAPGGGFVFNTVHNIQHDVPPQNIIAMWEAVKEYGKY